MSVYAYLKTENAIHIASDTAVYNGENKIAAHASKTKNYPFAQCCISYKGYDNLQYLFERFLREYSWVSTVDEIIKLIHLNFLDWLNERPYVLENNFDDGFMGLITIYGQSSISNDSIVSKLGSSNQILQLSSLPKKMRVRTILVYKNEIKSIGCLETILDPIIGEIHYDNLPFSQEKQIVREASNRINENIKSFDDILLSEDYTNDCTFEKECAIAMIEKQKDILFQNELYNFIMKCYDISKDDSENTPIGGKIEYTKIFLENGCPVVLQKDIGELGNFNNTLKTILNNI
ncbi:hypothetical protein [Sphingobacterium cavernae]|uniref:hypothetical protein n=1 Tax=Sphingobacterium cavernae TaxID=2592657 RepID=UPI00122FD1A5|nr:hypothetical protein [Sphingobacterium cavernae]